MMDSDLHDALAQISEIRRHMARTEVFRGYRSVPIAVSGVAAFLTALVQPMLVPEPSANPGQFVLLWCVTAFFSVVMNGAALVWRHQRATPVARSLSLLAVSQFYPCVAAGGLLSLVVLFWLPDSAWMLPGLWAILYSLGIFASVRLLDPRVAWMAHYYLVAGLAVLVLARGEHAFTPWAMVGTFGVGQLLGACLIYYSMERYDD